MGRNGRGQGPKHRNQKAPRNTRNTRNTVLFRLCISRISRSRDFSWLGLGRFWRLVKLGILDEYSTVQALQIAARTGVEDYLAGELTSGVRHEYVGGQLYAMAGASSEHNIISLNVAFALRSHLRGKPCQVFVADVKVKVLIADEEIFYYPDVMVTCDPRDTDRYFKRFPEGAD